MRIYAIFTPIILFLVITLSCDTSHSNYPDFVSIGETVQRTLLCAEKNNIHDEQYFEKFMKDFFSVITKNYTEEEREQTRKLILLGIDLEGDTKQKNCNNAFNEFNKLCDEFGLSVYKIDGNGSKEFFSVKRPTINKQEQPSDPSMSCPNKILGQNTVHGLYLGNECGDMCYSSIRLADGTEFVFVQDDTTAEQSFGEGIGQAVLVTYQVEQYWNEYGEICQQIPIFQQGRRLQ